MNVLICVGSSCHLKGSEKIVELFQNLIEKYNLKDDITLGGSFCAGKCNREGVTISVDNEIFTGITPETFSIFFNENILKKIEK